MDKEEEEMLK
jgi:hypothetical protein